MDYAVVDGSKVGLSKELKIRKTFKNSKLCMKAQLNFAKTGQAIENFDEKNDQTLIDSLQSQLVLFDGFVDFLKQILGLNKKQATDLEDADISDVTDLVNEICIKVLGPASDDKSTDE